MIGTLPGRPFLLAHADLLLLTADLLRNPRDLALPGLAEAKQVVDTASPRDTDLQRALESVLQSAEQTPREALVAEYHRLFEGSISCPINEAAYIRRDKGALLADISGFYRAFGLEHAPASGERPDHLRCELEFVSMLLVMTAQATSDDKRDIAFEALRSFVDDHLGEWLESFTSQLESTTALEFYAHLARFATELFRHTALAMDLPTPKPPRDQQPDWPPPEEEEELRCGLPGGKGPVPCTVSAEKR